MPLNDNRWGRHLAPQPEKPAKAPEGEPGGSACLEEDRGEGRPGQQPAGDGQLHPKDEARENAKDLEAAWKSFNDMLKGYRRAGGQGGEPPRGGRPPRPKGALRARLAGGLAVAVIFTAGAYLGAGFYTVPAGDAAALYAMGEFSRVVGPGSHWHLPWPFERVRMVDTRLLRRTEAVFTGADGEGYLATADGLLVRARAVVEWQVPQEGVRGYLEQMASPSQAIEAALRRALREEISDMTLRDAMQGRPAQFSDRLAQLVQAEADGLGLGIKIRKVEMGDVKLPEEAEDAARTSAARQDDGAGAYQAAQRWAAMADALSSSTARRISEEAGAYRQRVVHAAKADSSLLAYLQDLPASDADRQRALERSWSAAMEAALPGRGELSAASVDDIMAVIRARRPSEGADLAKDFEQGVSAADVTEAKKAAAAAKQGGDAGKSAATDIGRVEDRDSAPDRSEYLRNKGR